MKNNVQFLIYRSAEEDISVDAFIKDDTIWLTQKAMAAYNVWFFTYVVTLFRPGEKLHWKTFVTPANIATVAMLVLRLLPLDNVLRTGLMVIASCPAGSLAAVVAKQSGTEPALASQAVAHSTICMLVTVPVMLLLTGQLFPL